MNARRTAWLAVTIILFFGLGGCGSMRTRSDMSWQSPYEPLSSLQEGEILHLPTGTKISRSELFDLVSVARVIYVGEAHDNIHAHRVQLEILKALSERYPGEVVVGMEMLKRSSQEMADKWTAGTLTEKEFLRTWTKDWTNDFEYYRDILRFVRDEQIPLLALRPPDEWMARVKNSEAIEEPEETKEPLPDLDVEDPYHRAHTEAVFSKHPKHSQAFDAFYKVQVLWDETMAATVADFLMSEAGKSKRVLVFAGNQHVEFGFGIPRRVFRRIQVPYVIVLPMTVNVPPHMHEKLMDVTMPEIPLLPGDFAWIVDYEDLEDEKVFLGVMIQDTDDGVKILGTMTDSPAEKAGLEKGDIITALDGEPVQDRFDITYFVALKKPGEEGTVEVLRENKPLQFQVIFQTGWVHH